MFYKPSHLLIQQQQGNMSVLSPVSSFRALHRGKATPIQIRVCLLRRSLSFFDNSPSAEQPGFFFVVGSTSEQCLDHMLFSLSSSALRLIRRLAAIFAQRVKGGVFFK